MGMSRGHLHSGQVLTRRMQRTQKPCPHVVTVHLEDATSTHWKHTGHSSLCRDSQCT